MQDLVYRKTKVKVITEGPVPRNTTELDPFVGLINYYWKFLPNLSSTLSLLYKTIAAEHEVVVE